MIEQAAKNETSITMYVDASLVDLSVFTQGEHSSLIGVNGEHPVYASPEAGELIFNKAVKQLGERVKPIE